MSSFDLDSLFVSTNFSYIVIDVANRLNSRVRPNNRVNFVGWRSRVPSHFSRRREGQRGFLGLLGTKCLNEAIEHEPKFVNHRV